VRVDVLLGLAWRSSSRRVASRRGRGLEGLRRGSEPRGDALVEIVFRRYHRSVELLDAAGIPVDDRDYEIPFPFTGEIDKITIELESPKLSKRDVKKLRESQVNGTVNE
jgi:hypothetical protein